VVARHARRRPPVPTAHLRDRLEQRGRERVAELGVKRVLRERRCDTEVDRGSLGDPRRGRVAAVAARVHDREHRELWRGEEAERKLNRAGSGR
jgi:hypothetical protein